VTVVSERIVVLYESLAGLEHEPVLFADDVGREA
jgi:hypothetical protein